MYLFTFVINRIMGPGYIDKGRHQVYKMQWGVVYLTSPLYFFGPMDYQRGIRAPLVGIVFIVAKRGIGHIGPVLFQGRPPGHRTDRALTYIHYFRGSPVIGHEHEPVS